MNQFLLGKMRELWKAYNAHLPERVREQIIRTYRSPRDRLNGPHREFARIGLSGKPGNESALNPEKLGSGVSDRSANIVTGKTGAAENEAVVEPARRNDEEQRKNGLGDDPNTRINLSHGYLSGLIEWLAESDYDVMTYDDLCGPFRHGEEGKEFQGWCSQAAARCIKSVLLQYDVDARPDVTGALMRTHIEAGVPGNAMIFCKKMFDWKLRRHGIAEIDEAYQLDFDLLQEFQKAGSVVGYHCNALERAGGNTELALEYFHKDLAELRKYLDINYFSMHGGIVLPNGQCNATMNIQPHLDELKLSWVHNGHAVYFHSTWSDGGASYPPYRTECSDPLDFVLSTGEGERTRLLFHPQNYYDFTNHHFDYPVLHDAGWVREARQQAEAGSFNGKEYWAGRYDAGRDSIAKFKALFEKPQDEKPVFVNGMSRSGTTLLVSMFDAHPGGAMAYESYPHYLYLPSDGGVLTAEEFIYVYQTLINYCDNDNEAFKLLDRAPLRNLRLFAAVTSWTGMDLRETGELLRAYLVDHLRISDVRQALEVIAASARYKLLAQGAEFWGTKCQGNFKDYFDLWPQAKMVYIMRNGLDILASQKTTGAFNPDSAKLGKSWRDNYNNFMTFRQKHTECKMALVQYEKLVSEPEATCRALCEQINLDYHPQMIRQHEVETTLVRNPRGQLSAERVQQPIDVSSINKWRKILSQADVDAFLKGCGGSGLFEEYGYDWKF